MASWDKTLNQKGYPLSQEVTIVKIIIVKESILVVRLRISLGLVIMILLVAISGSALSETY